MDNIVDYVVIIAVIAFQTFAGRIGNRYLGAILPIVFLGFVLYFLVSGNLSLSFKDIVMPVIGTISLICIYAGGEEYRNKKIRKELEKMKAKDLSKK
ncbi:hypothetical protein [Enterococcus faecalis]|uniref:Holin n=1 Tax=Enterococcus faecalis ATCC 6055 TaxID=1169311 RepID=R3KMA6_ENTFL|nr:hypothetical protein [Enterococcus faecalis]EOK14526.1 hypothetical protein WOU_00951 [Enterococcus faecalis ATCC 6055]